MNLKTCTSTTAAPADRQRRRLVTAAAGIALAGLGAPAWVRAQGGPKIRIGY